MRFRSVSVGWLALLALAYLNVAGAQVPPQSPPSAALPVDALAQTLPSGLAQPFEQAWDVVELAGQPMLSDSQRPVRVVLRPQGMLWVDGGCNYFSGRVERDALGLFRISKYGSTHRACEKPPRSEAFLNSALMMVDNFRWDRGLLLRSGSSELLRLRPSANQDIQALEQSLGRRALPAAAAAAALAPAAASALQPARERPVAMQAAPARQVVSQDCRPVKARKGADKSRKAKAPVCQPIQAKAAKAAAGKASLRAIPGKSVKGSKAAKPAKSSAKPSKAQRVKAGPVAKGSAKKNTPAAHKRSKS
ncbi:MAG: META domain-containing protein [Burkholderiales bacterium]|nr:META domain-containing protein [Burkholderiales bacterium]